MKHSKLIQWALFFGPMFLVLATMLIELGLFAESSTIPPNFKVAFIGDHGIGTNTDKVFSLVKNEGAQLLLITGDLDYRNSPSTWENLLTSRLGSNFPVLAVVGNHDDANWMGAGGYGEKLQNRISRVPDMQCTVDSSLGPSGIGVKSSCTYKGLFFVLSGANLLGQGSSAPAYIDSELSKNTSPWKICAWHEQMRMMQVGTKGDATGWGVYESCLKHGAMVMNGHEHSYGRTHLLRNVRTQEVIDRSDPLDLFAGTTLVVQTGAGGSSLRVHASQAELDYWASVYTSDYVKTYPNKPSFPASTGTYGALFCSFNVDGNPNKSHCYFKDVRLPALVPDEFSIISHITPPACTDTAPPKITDLRARAMSSSQIDIQWSYAYTNIDQFELHRSLNGSDYFLRTSLTPDKRSHQDTGLSEKTTFFYKIRSHNCAGYSAFSDPVSATTPPADPPPGDITVIFDTIGDSFVNGTDGDRGTNYGAKEVLVSDRSPYRETFLKFDVRQITGPIKSAKVRMFVDNGTANGPRIYKSSTAWAESTITYNNSRSLRTGSVLDNKDSIPIGTWVEYLVTSAITADGLYSFVLVPESSDGLRLFSREKGGSYVPKLVITH